MATVNPPPIPRIPRQFLGDNETRAFFQQLQKILLQLFIKVDGGSDTDFSNLDDYLTAGDLAYLTSRLQNRVDQDQPELSIIYREINQLKQEIAELKADANPVFPLLSISQRIDDIEAQL